MSTHELNCILNLLDLKIFARHVSYDWNLSSGKFEFVTVGSFFYKVQKGSLMCRTHPFVHYLRLAFVLKGINVFLAISLSHYGFMKINAVKAMMCLGNKENFTHVYYTVA